jgi:MOSC domain-containing protein YiiM
MPGIDTKFCGNFFKLKCFFWSHTIRSLTNKYFKISSNDTLWYIVIFLSIEEWILKIIKAISISDRKGMRKNNIEATTLIAGFGLKNDAHAGDWHRQVSFLAEESIESMRQKGLSVVAGNFAENITTTGLNLTGLEVGTHITIGETELIISQLGKICHTPCAIYHQAGDCVMPREGIFAVVIKGGEIKVGDAIKVTDKHSPSTAIVSNDCIEKETVKDALQKTFQPAFIRFDTVNNKKGGNLAAIVEDLTATQKTKNIVIVDPTGELGLSLPGLPLQETGPNRYTCRQSTVYYCRSCSPSLALPI